MSDKPFDWDAFNKVLQGSVNICSGARKDIENAIAAGKRTDLEPALGQLWRRRGGGYAGRIYQVSAGSNGKDVLIGLNSGDRWSSTELFGIQGREGFEYVAPNLSDYIANGGTF